MSRWKPVTSGVSQRSTAGSILFSIYINDFDDDNLIKFAFKQIERTKVPRIKLGVVSSDECAVIQKDLDGLEKWANGNPSVQQKEMQSHCRGQQHPGLQEEECCHQGRRSDSPPLLNTGETIVECQVQVWAHQYKED